MMNSKTEAILAIGATAVIIFLFVILNFFASHRTSPSSSVKLGDVQNFTPSISVQPATPGTAEIVTTQTYTVSQLAQQVISRSQDIARTTKQRTQQDSQQAKQRTNQDTQQQSALKIAQDAYMVAGGDLTTLVIPAIQ